MPKTELGSNLKSVKDIEQKVGKNFIVKKRIGWGGRGVVSTNEFKENPKKYFNKDYIVQKKENLKSEYRVLVAEGEPVYVLRREKGEFKNYRPLSA